MDDAPTGLREFCPQRAFPWLRLVRGVGASLGPNKLALAGAGLVLTLLGWSSLDRLFPSSVPITPNIESLWPGIPELRLEPSLGRIVSAIFEPARVVIAPFLAFFSLHADSWSVVHSGLAALWSVCVWAIFGGAISRIAVTQAATGERIGATRALRYALERWVSLIGAPLSSIVGVLFFATLCAILGLLYQLPGPIGKTIAGVLAFLPLLAGLVMALVLVGAAFGWPLMTVSVMAEGEDGFDALSRASGYLLQRPGRYLFYGLLAAGFGIVGLLLVGLVAALTVRMGLWGLALGAPDAQLLRLFAGDRTVAGRAAAMAHAFWLGVVRVLAIGWVFSYFWSAVSLIYLVLRHDVDGTPFEVVDAESTEPNLLTATPTESRPHAAPNSSSTA